MKHKIIFIFLIEILLLSSSSFILTEPRDKINLGQTYSKSKVIPHVLTTGNIDNDEGAEIVFASKDSKIIILDHDLKQGPIREISSNAKEIIISDLNTDGLQDIIVIDSKTLYILDHNLDDQFKKDFDSEIYDIEIGNLDENEFIELLIGTDEGLNIFSWNESELTYNSKSYINDKPIFEVKYFENRFNRNPYIVARNYNDVQILTYNGGPYDNLTFEEIEKIGCLWNHVVIFGTKDNQTGLWKYALNDTSNINEKESLFFSDLVDKVFFNYFENEEMLVVYNKKGNNLISINLKGEENWNISISPISVDLFDLDNYRLKEYNDENYPEIIITSSGKISVYIYCWKKNETGDYQTEMILVEEYEIIEDVKDAEVFNFLGSFGKYIIVIDEEGKLYFYEIYTKYNLFINFYEDGLLELKKDEPDCEQALDDFDNSIETYLDIATYYGINKDDIDEKRQICINELSKNEKEILTMLGKGLQEFEHKNYEVAIENLSKVYAFYDRLNTKDDQIINETTTYSELRSILEEIFAELVIKIDENYSNENWYSAVDTLSYLIRGLGESYLGINQEQIPLSLEKYMWADERQKIFDGCINNLKKEAEDYEEKGKLKDALEIWKKIEEAYLRIGYNKEENEYKYEQIVVPIQDKVKEIENKIDEENRRYIKYSLLIIIPICGIIFLYKYKEYFFQNKNIIIERFLNILKNIFIGDDSLKIEDKREVFIVHGHDENLKNQLEIFLSEIGLKPIVLHRKADEGLAVIEKFERYSNVGYAFILLTPDDIGYSTEEESKKEKRARQNVIWEFGYFVGKLGRNKVCCLYKKEVYLPTDVSGMLYKEIKKNVEEVGYAILKELKKAGYNV